MFNKTPDTLTLIRRSKRLGQIVGSVALLSLGAPVFGAASTDAAGNTLVGVVGWPVFTTASDVAGNRLDGILPGPFAVDMTDISGNRLYIGALLPDIEGSGTEPTHTPTPTPTSTPGDGETPTPTPTSPGGKDFDLWPPEAGDGLIDARDLLELLKIADRGSGDLFEFSQCWKLP